MGIKIFISYIRDDSAASTGWLYDTIIKEFDKRNVFKDIDSIPLGVDFRKLIEKEVQNCDILLTIIGTKFTKITDKNGVLKIKNPNEFVNIEISSAINMGKIVIPVLVDNAKIPEKSELPENLRKLIYLNGIKLRYDSWNRDTEKLFNEIKNIKKTKQANSTTFKNSVKEITEKKIKKRPNVENKTIPKFESMENQKVNNKIWIKNNAKKLIISFVVLGIISISIIKFTVNVENKNRENNFQQPTKVPESTLKAEKKFKVGDYIQFGKYYDEPILWKCIKKDENEHLLVSEHIICLKAFDAAESGKADEGSNDKEKAGSNIWENSNIRKWLNSNKSKVEYSIQAPTKEAVWRGDNAYADEPGFLTNFTSKQIGKIGYYEHDNMRDRVFLLSEKEWKELSLNNRIKTLTKTAIENNDDGSYIKHNVNYFHWTRTPYSYSSTKAMVAYIDSKFYWALAYSGRNGIVPALNLLSDICKSGKGSEKEPYIV